MIAIVLLAQSGGFLPVYYRPRSISSGANAFMNFMTDISSINSPQYCTNFLPLKTHGFAPRNTPHKAENSEVRSLLEELQRDALPTHWWPCQTHRRLFFPTQGEGDNHVGRFHGGVAGEQPNRIQQPNGRDGNQIGLTVNVDVFCVDG